MNWKEQLQAEVIENYIFLAEMRHKAKDKTAHMKEMRANWEKLCCFIENLLEEQRKDNEILVNTILSTKDEQLEIQAIALRTNLINQILSEAPEDRDDAEWHMICDSKELKGFNQANQQWRELLTKHLI